MEVYKSMSNCRRSLKNGVAAGLPSSSDADQQSQVYVEEAEEFLSVITPDVRRNVYPAEEAQGAGRKSKTKFGMICAIVELGLL